MRKILSTTLFCALLSLKSYFADAAGITTHLFMADMAIDSSPHGDLKQFLEQHQNAIRNGSIFPDSGYMQGATYGEFAHWERFHNGYMIYLDQTCSWPLSWHCEELFAFFLGTLSHGLSDVYFHRDFITEVAVRDFKGVYNKAHSYSDPGVDMLSMLDYGRAKVIPSLFFPSSDLSRIFSTAGFPVLEKEINHYTHLAYVGLLGEEVASPFSYLYYKFKSPWAANHYYTAQGGVLDSARQIAEIWDQVWDRFQKEHGFKRIAFKVGGQWPQVQFTPTSEGRNERRNE